MQRTITVLSLAIVSLGGHGDAQEVSRTGSATEGFASVTVHVQHLDRGGRFRLWPLDPEETATVTLRSINMRPDGWPAPETFRATGRTDADGNITFRRLPLGSYRLFGESGNRSGDSSFYLSDSSFEMRHDLYLQEGRAFRGRVVNTRGEPVPSAVVKMSPRTGDIGLVGLTSPGQFVTTTNSDGTFSYESLWGSDEWSCRVDAEGYATGYESGFGLSEEALNLVLKRGGSVTGKILEKETQSPVGGARVVLRSSPSLDSKSYLYREFEATASSEGEFRFEGIGEGTYLLVFDHETFALESGYALVEVVNGEESSGHVLYGIEGATVRGRVYERETQEGIPGVAMDVIGARSVYGILTDDDGYYEATGLNTGEYHVAPGQSEGHFHSFRRFDTQVDVTIGESIADVDFALNRGFHVSGRVLDESGAPFAGIPVAAGGSGNGAVFRKAAVLTNDAGEFTIYGFAPEAEVYLSVRLSGYVEKNRPKIVIGDQDVEGIELILSRANSIRGVILDSEGEPPEGVRVYARLLGAAARAQDYFLAQTNARTGQFELSNLPIGKYGFVAYPEYYREQPTPAPVEISLGEGEHFEGVRLAYDGPETGFIRGVVVDSAGDPIHWAYLLIHDLTHSGTTPVSKRDGSFSMERVPAGAWNLRVAKEGYLTETIANVSTGTEDLKIVLRQ